MSFQQIRDQDVPIRLLRNMLERRRVPNGLLFWGPGGVGKRLAAFETAKAMNCARKNYDACDACLSCRKIANGNHPDVTVVAPVKKSRIIDVETLRTITSLASLRPFESAWRVFILQEADRMGVPAQNHFLKTLEEPPGNSLFILITEYPSLLLPTIRSRCQRVRFGTLRPETVTDLLLQQRDLPPDVAQSIAAVAQGQVSRALDLVDSNKRVIALDIVRRLAKGDDPLALAEEFAKSLDARRDQIEATLRADLDTADLADLSREDLEEQKKQQMAVAEALIRRDIMDYLYLLETWYRDALVYRTTGDAAQVLNRDQVDGLRQAKTEDFDKKFAAIEKARIYLERFLKEDRVFRDLFFVLAE
jgi:DNA polymerase-3 subunit delta'